MTDREILIEILAMKLFEHLPMEDGSHHNLSWVLTAPEDRQHVRDSIINATNVEDLYRREEEP